MPTEATFGLKPCWLAWFQNVVKSGGSTTPVTISQRRRLERGDLRREIVGEVLVAAGIGELVAELSSTGGKPTCLSPQALPSPSLGNSPPTDLLVASWPHMLVNTAMTSSSPQKKWKV